MFYKTGPPRQFEPFDLWDDSHVGTFIQKFEAHFDEFFFKILYEQCW